jgi:hypothetical protein
MEDEICGGITQDPNAVVEALKAEIERLKAFADVEPG